MYRRGVRRKPSPHTTIPQPTPTPRSYEETTPTGAAPLTGAHQIRVKTPHPLPAHPS
ncbi:hypothetical protein HMPREF9621_02108 [Cutibacterium modestum HL037PA2]|nr:hypothetical protein HMPREF9567_01022 [Cutibacterium acnes HL013PA1]EFS73527.1 hypothetical protein HMPREF9621_02108 [Cutibacterium modestum HL037PA2]